MAEFNLTPVFRMEMFIDAIINGTTPPEPHFREEFYFAKVAGMDVELPTPITRREFYLAKYAGMDVDLPVPVTRDEMYLALACGLGVEPPEPVFRDEYWLYELSGGGKWSWKTVTGALIHITDALASPMQKCEVTLEPIQDLHGQDAPYPAGGGKNIVPTTFPSNVINASFSNNGLITAATNARTFAIPCEPNTDYIASSKSGLAGTIGLSTTLPSVGDSLTYVCTFTSRTWYDFNSGNNSYIILAFASTDLFNEHESTYQFMIEKGSTATAFAPYSNICPITGWTGCEVTRTGENVFGGIALANRIKEVVPSAVIDENAKTITYSASSMSGKIFFTEFKPNKKYTFILNGTGSANMKIVYANGATLSLGTLNTIRTSNGNTLSFLGGEYATGTTILNYEQCGVFEGELTADDFEPYSGTTASVTFPDTVYGGSHEFVSGAGLSDRGIKVFDGSTSTSIFDYPAGNGFYFGIPEMKANYSPLGVCNQFKTLKSYGGMGAIFGISGSSYVYVINCKSVLGVSTVNDLLTYLQSHPLQFAFPLYEPTEIPLTPQPISTLKGVNNVWSNSNGDTTIIYKAQAS